MTVLYEDQHYKILHANFLIPGYLILEPLHGAQVTSFNALSTAHLSRLGPMFAIIEACLVEMFAPELIYYTKFGESVKNLHFHIIPRSQGLASLFRQAMGLSASESISGPALMEWIRKNDIALVDQVDSTMLKDLGKKLKALKTAYL